jgi:4-hydroxybenzoate polyprenyltransferase
MESARTLGNKVKGIVELIKFEHSIFALPFALMALFMVYGGWPSPGKTFWIIVCMVSARSASMAFNRIVDYGYDMRNPRTSQRPLQSGKVRLREAWVFTVLMTAFFIFSAAMLNRLAFNLSFVALAVLFGYSFMKRFSALSHLVLGMTLGLSPVGVWVAVDERITLLSVLLGFGVTFWVAGFDVLYALQDLEFDRKEGLASIPARFGTVKALVIASIFHVVTICLFAAAGMTARMGVVFFAGLAVVGVILLYEHLLVRKHGLSHINMAFFTMNGVVSILLFVFSLADIFLRGG